MLVLYRIETIASLTLQTAILPSMEIALTPEQQDFVRRAIESGRFERAEDAVREALGLWVGRERRRAEILAAVDAAQVSIDRGEAIEITQQSVPCGAMTRQRPDQNTSHALPNGNPLERRLKGAGI